MINVFGHNLIENTSERQIYTLCGGLIKVVSGTKIVSITKNIGYTRLFSIEELKKMFGSDFTPSRLSITTYNGDDAAQLVHFYTPETWNNSEIFQYFYPIDKEGRSKS